MADAQWSGARAAIDAALPGRSTVHANANPKPSRPDGPPAEQVRLALRIVLHLARLGRPEEGDVAGPETTQQGIAASLRATQGAVSKVLSQLGAVDVVRHATHHVRGEDRRMRVYFVTAQGRELVQRYRARFGDVPPP